jgi:hypothetical protein
MLYTTVHAIFFVFFYLRPVAPMVDQQHQQPNQFFCCYWCCAACSAHHFKTCFAKAKAALLCYTFSSSASKVVPACDQVDAYGPFDSDSD